MYVIPIPNQVIRPAIELFKKIGIILKSAKNKLTRLTNHWKTFDDPLFTLMNAKKEKAEQKQTANIGRP